LLGFSQALSANTLHKRKSLERMVISLVPEA
jgi:hypothetical protein